jgi:hypothetical protein
MTWNACMLREMELCLLVDTNYIVVIDEVPIIGFGSCKKLLGIKINPSPNNSRKLDQKNRKSTICEPKN